MGREIRRVPAGWSKENPHYDRSWREAVAEWKAGYAEWEAAPQTDCEWWDWAGPPPTGHEDCYRPDWTDAERTHYQLYETVSEGTPVTPAFATEDELIDYLVAHGDYWDQRRRRAGHSSMPCDPWPRDQAETFVRGGGWAPSMAIVDGQLVGGVEAVTK